MKLTIELSTDNEAFATSLNGELRQILGQVPRLIKRLKLNKPPAAEELKTPLLDSNGNTCGTLRLTDL